MIVVHLITGESNPWYNGVRGPFSSKTAAKDWIEEHAKKNGWSHADLHWDDKDSCYILDGDEGGYEIITLPNEPIR